MKTNGLKSLLTLGLRAARIPVRPQSIQMRFASLTIFTLVLLSHFSVPESASAKTPAPRANFSAPTKVEVITRLRGLQGKAVQESASLDASIRKRLVESLSINLKDERAVVGRRITRLTDHIADIEKKRSEANTRREFIDQLILAVDSKWNGQNLQSFLENTALDMALSDLTVVENGGDIWRFCLYLSIAIREIPGSRENPLDLVESYLGFSPILNPRTPADFLANQDYSNSKISAPAQATDREASGDLADHKLSADVTSTSRPLALKTDGLGDKTERIELNLKNFSIAEPRGTAPATKPSGADFLKE